MSTRRPTYASTTPPGLYNWEQAAAEQERLVALFSLVDVGPEADMGRSSSALGAFKAALHLLGVIDRGATAFPQRPLSEEAVAEVGRRLMAAGLLPRRDSP